MFKTFKEKFIQSWKPIGDNQERNAFFASQLEEVIQEALNNRDEKDIESKPYKCPICEGRGQVDGHFYLSVNNSGTTSVSAVKCISCQGNGIVWSINVKA